ncbi:glycoside hydrolase family 3 protein [Micromonospora soli]|uniref:glycoside hydrolase family 3 protein n=1 Tax=Micromonospora sp. NBRC 110009 TaxID=3061627 RepID=UPI002673089B|nr:glycoside hydrolase family 3 protein [Micromonospora sp. NBRC 110009]WKT96920.1 glycoside hydrolase family 3 protein [Micromonospora sp. NBRC 110009]
MRSRRNAVLVGAGALAVSLLPAPPAAAADSQMVTVTTDRAVYPAAEGSHVPVTVAVTTSDGRPLATATTVRYATGAGTATAGADYAAASGELTFPAGSPSGVTRRLTVAVQRDRSAETAETVPLTLTSAGATVAGRPTVVIDAHGLPYLNSRLPVEKQVADLLGRMTLAEKIGQMTQAERAAVTGDPTAIARWQLGSVLSGGGSTPASNTPTAWVEMVNTFQAQALSTRLQIPMIYGIDAVHGHGNVYGATVFPHNVGLGATRDPKLVERIGQATAAEVRATGIPWDFSPCVCVSRDERWGRSYESFGEDPALVVSMESVIDGLQGRGADQFDADRVLATAKHYAGDGDTDYDEAAAAANAGKPWWEQKYTIDQGVTVTDRAHYARVDLAPYPPAVRAHKVGSVMPSFSSVDWTEDGLGNPTKMHANHELITDVLKGQMGFDGFLISDWEGIHQIPDPSDPTNGGLTAYKVRVGVNAGTDMFMEPNTAEQFEQLLMAEATAGRVSRARIDDAVRRILRKKFELGLFEHPYASTANVDQVGSAAHRAIAWEAVAKSQVLLKNSGQALPLRRDASIYVAGRNADDLGNQAGGWTISWQGGSGSDAIPGTSILDGIREVAPGAQVTYSADASAPTAGAQVGVVVVGETPYAEGYGDVGGPECGWCSVPQQEEKSLSLQAADRAVIDKVCTALPTCVVLVVSGRPQILTDQLGEIDALVASWLPGSEGAGVADVLFGRRPFTGRLPVSWPRTEAQVPINVGDADYQPLYPFGWGLRTDSGRSRLAAAAGDGSQVTAALTRATWDTDGSLRNAPQVLPLLSRQLGAVRGDSGLVDAILGVARDAAQAAVVHGTAPADWATLIAEADRAQLNGDPVRAFTLLARAAS